MRGHADFEQLILDAKMVVGIDPFTKPWRSQEPIVRNTELTHDVLGLEVLGGHLEVSVGLLDDSKQWSLFDRLKFFGDRTEVVSTCGHIILNRIIFSEESDGLSEEEWSLFWGIPGFMTKTPKSGADKVAVWGLGKEDQRELYDVIERPLLASRPEHRL